MKKTNLFGCALVVLALVFAACPTGGGGGGGDVPLQPEQSTAPSAPTAPVVVAADQQLTITWTVVANATAYEVWYGTESGSASAVKYGADVTGTTATITGLTNGATYYVWIKAKNIIGTSAFSPSATGTPAAPLSAPAAPAAAPTLEPGNARIVVSWSAVAGATAYEVWYGTGSDSGSAEKFADVTETTATIRGLTNDATYYVWIKAKNTAGISAFSPSASAIPVNYIFTTPEQYREMVSFGEATITGSEAGGVFITGNTVTLSAFNMAKHETTYELWKEVYDWAVNNGYTFAHAGAEGHGTEGTGTESNAALRKSRPVTTINWRDAVVWCNAYSELSGKMPVYYTDTGYGTILKVSTDAVSVVTAADRAVMKPGANGYRLPTEAEWEYAARGGDQGAGSWDYTYAGSNTIGDVAWYQDNAYAVGNTNPAYGAHPVGTKTANSAGLYDMTGNVREWCWDWYAGSIRVLRGGSWYHPAADCAVAYRYYGLPDYETVTLGFRVVSCP